MYVIEAHDGFGKRVAGRSVHTLEEAQSVMTEFDANPRAYSVDVYDCNGTRLIFGKANGMSYTVNAHGDLEWDQ